MSWTTMTGVCETDRVLPNMLTLDLMLSSYIYYSKCL